MSTVGDKSNFSLQWTRLATSQTFAHTFSPKFQTSRRTSESTFAFRLPEKAFMREFSISPVGAYKLVIPSVTIKLIVGITTLKSQTFSGGHSEKVFDLSMFLPAPKGSRVFIQIAKTTNPSSIFNHYSCTLWGQFIRD